MKKKRKEVTGVFLSVYATELGFGGAVASDKGLIEIFMPEAGSEEEMKSLIQRSYLGGAGENELTSTVAGLLGKYFSGKKVDFVQSLDTEGLTDFQRDVYEAVSHIPHGSVRSYKEIAEKIGRPGAARGIGAAMAANPLPVVIPCHRVVGAGGEMTGYSAPGGIDLKIRLLLMEGVEFHEGGKKVKM